MNPNTEVRSTSVPFSLSPCQGRKPGKGPSPKVMRGTHPPGSAAKQERDCHTLKGVLRCVYMQYDIILHFVPVFKPVFLLSVQIFTGTRIDIRKGIVKGRS